MDWDSAEADEAHGDPAVAARGQGIKKEAVCVSVGVRGGVGG